MPRLPEGAGVPGGLAVGFARLRRGGLFGLFVGVLVVALMAGLVSPGVASAAGSSALSRAAAVGLPAAGPVHRNTVREERPLSAEVRAQKLALEAALGRMPMKARAAARAALASKSAAASTAPVVSAQDGVSARAAEGSPFFAFPAAGLPGEMIWGVYWRTGMSGSLPPPLLTLNVVRASDNAPMVSRTISAWTQQGEFWVQSPATSPNSDAPDQVRCLRIFDLCGWYFLGPPFVAGTEYRVTIAQPNGTFTSPAYRAVQYGSIPASLAGVCTCDFYAYRGDPVNTGTGALLESFTDVSLPGAGRTFAMDRHYRSDSDRVGLLGRGWSTGLEARLVAGTGTQTLVEADGSQVAFTQAGDGSWVAPKPVRLRLTPESGGGFTVTALDKSFRRFGSGGRLTRIANSSSVGLTLAYASGRLATVTDAAGRAVAMTVNGAGRLTRVTLPDGRFVEYGYTGTLLTSVRGLNGGTSAYGYDAGERLSTIEDARGNTSTTTYDATTGRVTQQEDAAGKVSTFAWDAARQVSTMTDPNGGAWTDRYAGGALISRLDGPVKISV